MEGFRRLPLEWTNADDEGGDGLIAKLQQERAAEKQPPLTASEIAFWRWHARVVRRVVRELHDEPWGKVFVAAAARDYGERRADNPYFIGALLRLLDTRPISVEELQITLDIACGHLYRFLERAGIEWTAASGYMGKKADEDELGRRANFYRDPLSGFVLNRGRVVRIKGEAGWWNALAPVLDDRPLPLPRFPRAPAWLRKRARAA